MHRRATKTLEFRWDALSTPLPNDDSLIFAHLLDSHYTTPTFEGSTITQRAASFVTVMNTKAAWYNTTNILVPWGTDFDFINASQECESH
jgi:hypothetical protein